MYLLALNASFYSSAFHCCMFFFDGVGGFFSISSSSSSRSLHFVSLFFVRCFIFPHFHSSVAMYIMHYCTLFSKRTLFSFFLCFDFSVTFAHSKIYWRGFAAWLCFDVLVSLCHLLCVLSFVSLSLSLFK